MINNINNPLRDADELFGKKVNEDYNLEVKYREKGDLVNFPSGHYKGHKIYESQLEVLRAIKPLKDYDYALKELKIVDGYITNLSCICHDLDEIPKSIKSLERIKSLGLRYSKITEIKNLEKLTQLEHLCLSHGGISEIKGINNLVNLKSLDLMCNQITKIKGLENLTNLESLYLNYNNIEKLKGVLHLRKLKELWIDKRIIFKGLYSYDQLVDVMGVKIQLCKPHK